MPGCHTSSPAAFHLPPLDRVPRYMDAAADQWHQELGLVKSMEMVSFSAATTTTTTTTTTSATNTCSTAAARPQVTEKRGRPQKEQALNCPRCNSTNTKFCYYNNYSLTQPRYFCKACRRYWTEGGSLRNVPVGGGSRKNKRLSLSSSSSSITTTTTPVTSTAVSSLKNNPSITELNLPLISFSTPHHDLNPSGLPEFSEFTNLEDNSNGASVRGIRAFAPLSLPEFPAGFELQELRAPAHDFPMQGSRGQYARVLFPFEDMKPAAVHSSANEADFDNSRGQSGHPPAALWNGMIGGGGTW